jgi:uncharacterized protein
MKLLLTGATGFIGRALAAEARRRGHAVVGTTRGPDAPGLISWDPKERPLPPSALEGVDAVIHLAGENVASGRWTKRRMQEFRDSRIQGTRNVVASFADGRPRTLVCASAIGWYGERGDEVLTEAAAPADDFLGRLAQDWEGEAARVCDRGARWVSIRTGVVLGPEGGALARMIGPFRMNVGGPVAGGRQWMSWIHIDDIAGLYLHAVENPSISGPMLGVAPKPVRNAEFTKALARALGKWAFLPMPGFMLRIILGKFADVVTMSQRAEPGVALRTGYAFKYPEIEGALRQIVG